MSNDELFYEEIVRRNEIKNQKIDYKFLGTQRIEDINNGFIKHDDGKAMISLIEPQFIVSLGDVLTFGANKYAKNNWKLCENTDRYKDALLRHIYAYLNGEIKDPESKMDHLSHAAFGLMCLQYFDNKKETE